MSNPTPILCDTESLNTVSDNFKNESSQEPVEKKQHQSINSKLKSLNGEASTSLTIAKISEKFNKTNNIVDENANEKSNDEKFNNFKTTITSLVGDMRVDILALVNLISVLNKNVVSESAELANIKKELKSVAVENAELKEKLNTLLANNASEQSPVSQQTQQSQQMSSEPIADKQNNKIKIVPAKKKDTSLGMSSRQVLRREALENNNKKVELTKDSKSIRASRLGLQHVGDKVVLSK